MKKNLKKVIIVLNIFLLIFAASSVYAVSNTSQEKPLVVEKSVQKKAPVVKKSVQKKAPVVKKSVQKKTPVVKKPAPKKEVVREEKVEPKVVQEEVPVVIEEEAEEPVVIEEEEVVQPEIVEVMDNNQNQNINENIVTVRTLPVTGSKLPVFSLAIFLGIFIGARRYFRYLRSKSMPKYQIFG